MAMKQNTLVTNLNEGNAFKQLIIFSLPFMLANLLQQIYNMTDMVIVGRFVGSAGLSAASNGGEIATIFLFVCFGFTNAGQVIISQHIGAGSNERIGKVFGNLFTFCMICAVAFTIFPILFVDRFIAFLNVPPEAAEYCRTYAVIYFLGHVPVFGYNCIASILRGLGNSKAPLIFVAVAASVNIVLDLLFVAVLGWECKGAAIATVIGQTCSFITAVIFLIKSKNKLGFTLKLSDFRLDKKELSVLVPLGIPMTIQNVAVVFSMMFVMRYINGYSLAASATTAVANKMTFVATICTGALQTAGNSMIGQAFAAGLFDRVKKVFWNVFWVGFIYCGILSIILIAIPEQLFALFNPDPAVLELCHKYVPFGVLNLLGFACRSGTLALINGTGNPRLALIGGIVDGIVARIGFCLLLGLVFRMELVGFWFGMALSAHVFTFIGGYYFFSGKWEKRKLVI
ncbi:MAG: MATE family efflux transporter [Oscillospiraceae bacterium]|nr:MATE family efflux transporter [Oscillospiraceae bacterium]